MPGKAAGKAAKQKAAPPAASVRRTEELRRCGTCDEKKEKAEYTSSQWKKDTRQCKACAEAGPASDPKPEETAGAAPEEGLQADANAGPLRPCSFCQKGKAKPAYTGGQWKKKDAERQCKECAEAEEALLAPAAEAEAKRKRDEKEAREKAEAERNQKLASGEVPDSDRAREKRAEIASERVLLDEGSAEEFRAFAKLLDVDTAGVAADDRAALRACLLDAVNDHFLKKPAAERALNNPYLLSRTMDELKGLACEVDIYDEQIRSAARRMAEPEITKGLLVDLIKASAKMKSNKRQCATCSEWKKKPEYGQNQWKKTTGSKCKACVQKEDDERKFFENYERMYGHSPNAEQEDVYTSQANLYETLGVAENASNDELKKAYKRLAIKMHPDRWAHREDHERLEAESQFKLISEAYETLSSSDTKRAYDKDLAKKQKKAKKKEEREAAAASASA